MKIGYSIDGTNKIGEFEISEAPALDLSFARGKIWYKITKIIDDKNVLVCKTNEDGQ